MSYCRLSTVPVTLLYRSVSNKAFGAPVGLLPVKGAPKVVSADAPLRSRYGDGVPVVALPKALATD